MGNIYQKTKKPTIKSVNATIILSIGLVALLIVIPMSISVGAADINITTVLEAILHFNPTETAHQIIYEIRIPRTLVGAMAGIGFALSGCIMQGMTRNPIASPEIMGVTSGASFAISLAFAFLPQLPYRYLILLSFIGAILASLITYIIGNMSEAGITHIRLALAGMAISSLLSSLATGISIFFNTSQDVVFWFTGSVSGVKWLHVIGLLPWITSGVIAAIFLSPAITILSLGEETAIGLGQNVKLIKILGTIVFVALAGSCVSAVGPVGFIGLIIPHITRFLVGTDYRFIIPCSAVMGGLFFLMSDIIARMINPPFETPIGVITSLIGIPFYLYLVRKNRGEL